MNFPAELKYSESHEWVKVEGDTATIGITEFASEELGDVVFVDIPELIEVGQGDTFGSIEAVKTVSDLIAPVAGTLTEKNEALDDTPETVNSDPYGDGWMVKMTIADKSQLDGLMDVEAYKKLIGK
ncbi:MAG: glycine cleavage system protein H [Ectothiorhodospiraceae bacterium]|nr:glycine cleavage system protein H [Ectothiorhodospiraceae bacterium]